MTSAHILICKFNPHGSSHTISTGYFIKMSALSKWIKINSEGSRALWRWWCTLDVILHLVPNKSKVKIIIKCITGEEEIVS